MRPSARCALGRGTVGTPTPASYAFVLFPIRPSAVLQLPPVLVVVSQSPETCNRIGKTRAITPYLGRATRRKRKARSLLQVTGQILMPHCSQ